MSTLGLLYSTLVSFKAQVLVVITLIVAKGDFAFDCDCVVIRLKNIRFFLFCINAYKQSTL